MRTSMRSRIWLGVFARHAKGKKERTNIETGLWDDEEFVQQNRPPILFAEYSWKCVGCQYMNYVHTYKQHELRTKCFKCNVPRPDGHGPFYDPPPSKTASALMSLTADATKMIEADELEEQSRQMVRKRFETLKGADDDQPTPAQLIAAAEADVSDEDDDIDGDDPMNYDKLKKKKEERLLERDGSEISEPPEDLDDPTSVRTEVHKDRPWAKAPPSSRPSSPRGRAAHPHLKLYLGSLRKQSRSG